MELEDALAPVTIEAERAPRGKRRRSVAEYAEVEGEGTLHVLPTGPLPADAAEFLGRRAVGDVLEQLRDRADLVLIDTTPLLVVGDAMTLTGAVDAVVLVMKAKFVRRGMLRELGRVLAACPAETLGFVITGGPLPGDDYGFGGYRYGPKPYTRAAAARS